MRDRVRLKHLRRNPLGRRSDVVAAWTALVVTALLVLAAPLLGAAAAWWAHDQARTLTAQQRAERQQVRAEVTGRTPDALPSVQGAQHTYRVTVRWTEPDGAVRTATTRVPDGTRTGDRVQVWVDEQGRSVPPPPGEASVWQHTLTTGLCATGGAVAVILLGHAMVRRVALRHRMAEWERDWARTEPEWTRRHRA